MSDWNFNDDWPDDAILDDPGPSVTQLARDVAEGRMCFECNASFKKAQPRSTPNREKTLCRVCARLFLESHGYNMGPERDSNSEGWAEINRTKRNKKNG